MTEGDTYYPPVSATKAGLSAKCPRCGRGELFAGYLTLKDECPRCGLDYTVADAGDGPAVFVIFITGTVGVALAFILLFGFGAPEIVALLVPVFVTVGLTFALLRPMKATMVALQYRNAAREGRLK